MSNSKCSVTKNQTYGYFQLARKPESDELDEFYENHYENFFQHRLQSRAANAKRDLQSGNSQKQRDSSWEQECFYGDILEQLRSFAPCGHLLEVGSGNGHFINFLAKAGYQVTGIDPSPSQCEIAKSLGLKVHQTTLQEAAKIEPLRERFDIVIMMNVLEHLPDAPAALYDVACFLKPGGHLLIKVPNEFSVVQKAASEALGHSAWWISDPDHVNYFDRNSLALLAEDKGFDVLKVTADFPIDWFLLMGEDYVVSPELGTICHEKRKKFELALTQETRLKLYDALANLGMGRNIILHAQKRPAR